MHTLVKKATNFLQLAYTNNAIAYPRVDNDFVKKSKMDLFPHPPMRRFSEPFYPIKVRSDSKIQLNKKSALLFLSMLRVVSPSTMASTAKILDVFFDDDLNFVSDQAHNKFLKIKQIFSEYCEKNAVTTKTLVGYPLEFYSDASDANTSGMIFFSTKDYFFVEQEDHNFKSNTQSSLLNSFSIWDYKDKINEAKKKKKPENQSSGVTTDEPIEYIPMDLSEIKDGLRIFKQNYIQRKSLYDLQVACQENMSKNAKAMCTIEETINQGSLQE